MYTNTHTHTHTNTHKHTHTHTHTHTHVQAEEEEEATLNAQKLRMIDDWPCDGFTIHDCTENYPVCVCVFGGVVCVYICVYVCVCVCVHARGSMCKLCAVLTHLSSFPHSPIPFPTLPPSLCLPPNPKHASKCQGKATRCSVRQSPKP